MGSYKRIIQVMNVAYGQPTRESMPFDLALHRLPITFNLPEDASAEIRKAQREELARDLEVALKAILTSDAYKTALVKPVTYREPLDGRARFRAKGRPLGYGVHPLNEVIGGKQESVKLVEGAATWLRVAPSVSIAKPLELSQIHEKIVGIAYMPLCEASESLKVRSDDGYGFCGIIDEYAISVTFAFTDGEVWSIGTWSLQCLPDIIALDERRYAATLTKSTEFLATLGIAGPYRWVAGMEGVEGRSLGVANTFNRARGTCAADLIEETGLFSTGDDAANKLEPFFRRLFDLCGVRRLP
jgi:hypothetical protein